MAKGYYSGKSIETQMIGRIQKIDALRELL